MSSVSESCQRPCGDMAPKFRRRAGLEGRGRYSHWECEEARVEPNVELSL